MVYALIRTTAARRELATSRPRRSAVRPPKPNQSPIAVSKAAPSSPEPTAKRRNVLAFEFVPTPAASSEVRSAAARAVALPVYNYGSAATQPGADASLLVLPQTTSERCIAANASSLAALPFRDAARQSIVLAIGSEGKNRERLQTPHKPAQQILRASALGGDPRWSFDRVPRSSN